MFSTCSPKSNVLVRCLPVSRGELGSSEISTLAPCAYAQNGILHIKYADKNDD